MTKPHFPRDPLSCRIPRITEQDLAVAETDVLAEEALHRAMFAVEGGPESERLLINRLPVLIVAWNRCTDREREQFLVILREVAGPGTQHRGSRGT